MPTSTSAMCLPVDIFGVKEAFPGCLRAGPADYGPLLRAQAQGRYHDMHQQIVAQVCIHILQTTIHHVQTTSCEVRCSMKLC